jgi:hypothetical protein
MKHTSAKLLLKYFKEKKRETRFWLEQIVYSKEMKTILNMNQKTIKDFFTLFIEEDSDRNPFKDVRIAKLTGTVTECGHHNDLYCDEEANKRVRDKIFKKENDG